ncbi:hypothetical protein FLAG1_08508 [Fusarium langsethiae]|uniref:Uncharacterized protein n=1 Tax=Fusarium langsethiae TaxID=179993 RepID=A0A0N0DCS5_FUSLA|nr:hypothetical protein FLAG1_08508 [Fusarium langsethiae]
MTSYMSMTSGSSDRLSKCQLRRSAENLLHCSHMCLYRYLRWGTLGLSRKALTNSNKPTDLMREFARNHT